MPHWETVLLPWDLLCFPGRITWGGDKIGDKIGMDMATARLGENITGEDANNCLTEQSSWKSVYPIKRSNRMIVLLSH